MQKKGYNIRKNDKEGSAMCELCRMLAEMEAYSRRLEEQEKKRKAYAAEMKLMQNKDAQETTTESAS